MSVRQFQVDAVMLDKRCRAHSSCRCLVFVVGFCLFVWRCGGGVCVWLVGWSFVSFFCFVCFVYVWFGFMFLFFKGDRKMKKRFKNEIVNLKRQF